MMIKMRNRLREQKGLIAIKFLSSRKDGVWLSNEMPRNDHYVTLSVHLSLSWMPRKSWANFRLIDMGQNSWHRKKVASNSVNCGSGICIRRNRLTRAESTLVSRPLKKQCQEATLRRPQGATSLKLIIKAKACGFLSQFSCEQTFLLRLLRTYQSGGRLIGSITNQLRSETHWKSMGSGERPLFRPTLTSTIHIEWAPHILCHMKNMCCAIKLRFEWSH